MSPEVETQAPEAASGPAPERVAPDDGWIGARAPRAAEILARIARFPALALAQRDLVGTSLRRDLEARFQGTMLGWFWPLVHPLFLFGVYYFVFTELLGFRAQGLPESQKAAMGVYMFCGASVWAPFAESLHRGASSIVDNGSLIKKLAFPSELLPLNVTLVGLVTMLFAVAMFLLAAAFTPLWPAPGPALVWIPLLVLLQGLFTFGVVLFLSTLQVFLRDTLQLVGILTTVWMFLTPVFWAPEVVSKKVLEYAPFLELNPMAHLLHAWRGALMGEVLIPASDYSAGGAMASPAALPAHAGVFAVWAVLVFATGYAFFVYSQRRFADEV